MAIRKNKKFIDPRYFMDEKTEIVKEELRDYYDGESHSQSERDATQPRRPEELDSIKSPERADDQQSYEMAMGASRDTIMSVFGEEGELVWNLIETALHAQPGSFETVMPLHQEIEDLARIDSEVRSDMKEY